MFFGIYFYLLFEYNRDIHMTWSQYYVTCHKNYVNAKNFLEKRYQEDMELEDAIHTALLTLREGFEGEMNGHNIEVGVVSKSDGQFRLLTPEQIQDYLDEAN